MAASSSSFNTLLRMELGATGSSSNVTQNSVGLTQVVQRLLQPHRLGRMVNIHPIKILEAPGLLDDFYLNLIDWAPHGGPIAVALGKSIVFIERVLGKRSRTFRFSTASDGITCIKHAPASNALATGLSSGSFLFWDRTQGVPFFSLPHIHAGRIGAISWRNANILSVGGRDRKIQHIDIRTAKSCFNGVASAHSHSQEICGLAWDPSGMLLASGGNDNRLLIWDARQMGAEPLVEYTDHLAAVKAIAWSPSLRNVLVSGGGTLDRRLVLRDISAAPIIVSAMDTGSQVCNVQWSPDSHSLELITSHGYTQNQLVLWRVSPQFAVERNEPKTTITSACWGINTPLPPGARLTPLVHFEPSSERIVHMAADPAGEHVITGAGDHTLKLWSVFRPQNHQKPD
ncbi:substrate-specific activator of APC-dependent proteolysis [Mitosporidium daphniae]